MATRKIKDAKDLSTNELIYFKGHAKATYMSDGRTVEDAIPNNLSKVATSGSYNDLKDKPTIGDGSVEWVEGDVIDGAFYDYLETNKVYVLTNPTSDITIADLMYSNTHGNEYTMIFHTHDSQDCSITFPADYVVLYANGNVPTIELDTTYELSMIRFVLNDTQYINVTLTPFK